MKAKKKSTTNFLALDAIGQFGRLWTVWTLLNSFGRFCPKLSKRVLTVHKCQKVSKSVQTIQNCPKLSKSVQTVQKCPKASKLSKSVQKRSNSPKVSKSVSRGVQNTTKSPKPKILSETFFCDTL